MKHRLILCLLAILRLTGAEVPAQPLFDNSTSGSAGLLTANTTTAPAAQRLNAGSYVARTRDGYWQKRVISNNTENGCTIAIRSRGATSGCTFRGNGIYTDKHIEVHLSKINPDPQATMTISVDRETAKVFTSNFDDRLKLMSFCGGGTILAGNYKREKTGVHDLSWYKLYTGKIDRYPITMHLHKSGHRYNGYYYYDLQQRPIYFSGEDSSTKGKIKLTGFGEAEFTEDFVLTIAGNQLLGDWKKKENARPLTFAAVESKGAREFSYIYTSGALPLRPKLRINDAPGATYYAAAIWPAGETPQDLVLKKIIRKSCGVTNTGTEEIGVLFLHNKKAFFAAYLKENQNVKDIEIKQLPTNYIVDESKNLMVAHATPKIITLALSSYSYNGGAHGNYGTSYTCIDLVNNKELRLADVITQQGAKALSSLLEKSFRQRYHLQPGESLVAGGLFENTIKPGQNFYVTPTGLAFNYVPYEIGPYALGEVNLFIPINEIEKYLQPAIRRLLE